MNLVAAQSVAAWADEDQTLIVNGWEPVVVHGKAPVVNGWQQGPVTPERMAAEREAYPDALSTGIRTGRVVGVDIDVVEPVHVEKIKELASAVLGMTPFIRIGAKGAMLVYRNETPIKKITVATSKGERVEELGEGQQFVAYGIHPDTRKPYDWPNFGLFDPSSAPLSAVPAVTPDQLREFATQVAALLTELGYGDAKVTGDVGAVAAPAVPSQAKGEPVTVEELVSVLRLLDPNAERGTWRDEIAAIRATPGIEVEDLREIAQHYSRGDYHGGTMPALYTDDAAVSQVFDTMPPKDGGVSYGTLKAKARTKGWQDDPRPAEQVFAKAIEKLKADVANDDDAGPVSGWDDWQDMPFPRWLFEGLLPEGGIVTVNGKSQSFKSFIICELLYSLATGKPAFGSRFPETTGSCVYVPVEGKYSFKAKRIRALKQDRGVIPRNLFVYEKVPQITSPEDWDKLVKALRKINKSTPIKVVAFDHAAGILGGLSANDRENLQLLWKLARDIVEEFGCTVIMVVHPPKSAADDEANSAGSYGFFADVDTFLQVSRTKGTRNAKVEIAKQKDGEEGGEIFLTARLVDLGRDPKGRPVSSFVLDETSAEAVANERDQDRVTVEFALEQAGAISEAAAITAERLAWAVARTWDPTFPERGSAVTGGRADLLAKAHKLVRRMRENEAAADLRFKAGKSDTSPFRWRLQPKVERTLAPALREPAAMGNVPDRKEGDL